MTQVASHEVEIGLVKADSNVLFDANDLTPTPITRVDTAARRAYSAYGLLQIKDCRFYKSVSVYDLHPCLKHEPSWKTC